MYFLNYVFASSVSICLIRSMPHLINKRRSSYHLISFALLTIFFLLQDYSWTDIRCPFEKRRDAACVFWDNVVYILGGSQLFPIKRMDCYNVVKDSWYSKLGPPTPRDSLAACAAEGKIYTSGGSEVGKDLLGIFVCKKRFTKYFGKVSWLFIFI